MEREDTVNHSLQSDLEIVNEPRGADSGCAENQERPAQRRLTEVCLASNGNVVSVPAANSQRGDGGALESAPVAVAGTRSGDNIAQYRG